MKIWRNTSGMPFLLRIWCQGGMIAGPILLFFVLFPVTDWTVNGREMSYREFWSSGAGATAATFVGLFTVGAWGMAARIPASRWALVLSPLLPLAFMPAFMVGTTSLSTLLLGQAITAAIVYWCLFRLNAVRQYFLAGKQSNVTRAAD
jgi:hypothetical protein